MAKRNKVTPEWIKDIYGLFLAPGNHPERTAWVGFYGGMPRAFYYPCVGEVPIQKFINDGAKI